jgi:hypothetical protein
MMKHSEGPWKVYFGGCPEATNVCNDSGHVGSFETAEDARLASAAPEMFDALRLARMFIINGIELGFIRMPDKSTHDPVHDTLPSIEAALAKAAA